MHTSNPATVMSDCRATGCARDAVGHALNFAQRRAAAASSRKWRDAVVVDVTNDGWVTLGLVHDESSVRVWLHVDETATPLTPGEPVALHGVFKVLSRGREWFSVLIP